MATKLDPVQTRVIGYIRVSTATQADSGHSLDAQRHRLQQYAAALDLELVAVHVDAGLSAKSLDRPGLQAALAALGRDGVSGLLIAKLDRLTRSVADLGALVERYFADRYSLLSVADSIDTRTAGGRLVLNVLASVSQWEREAAAERTREGLGQARRDGAQLGTIPIGQRRTDRRDSSGRLTVEADPRGAATVARARSLRASGRSYKAVASALQAEGRPAPRGGQWHAASVRRVLLRAG